MKKITLLFCLAVAICRLFAQTVTTVATNVPIDDDLILAPDGSLIGSHYNGTALSKLGLDGASEVFATGFDTPNGLAYDSQGRLFMADNRGNKVYKFDAEGNFELFAEFSSPSGLLREWDSDTLIATSYAGDKLVRIAPDGSIADFVTDSRLNGPVGLCYDEAHNLYIANFDDRRIFKLTPEGALSDFAHPGTGGWLGFIAYAQGYIYATLFSRHQIWRIDSSGQAEQWLGSTAGSADGDASEAKFNGPNGIRASSTGDTLFVSDFNTRSVRMVTGLNPVVPGREINKAGMRLTINPNPVSGPAAIVRLELPGPASATLQLFDGGGRLVQTAFAGKRLPAGEHEFKLPVNGLSPGTYHCRLSGTKGDALTQQLVIGK
ncbi:MAG: hypothetical protein J5I98_16770 [Phaeodactylibacter sp.]|nr:hypothetical protein [Phaeodactylibacter sp.]